MRTFKIEDNVPIPPARPRSGKKRRHAFPFRELGVGQSFFVPNVTFDDYNSVKAAASNHKQRWGGQLTIRVMDGGVRVWRKKKEDRA